MTLPTAHKFWKPMTQYRYLILPACFCLLLSCNNSNKKSETAQQPTTPGNKIMQPDSKGIKPALVTMDTLKPAAVLLNNFNDPGLPADAFIKEYAPGQQSALKQYITALRNEWKGTPNPIIATYQGNDFGDYQHILFKDAGGKEYDFGQASNNYGPYQLHETSGQYRDNPEYVKKKFKVYWDWKLADFPCCDGVYGKAKAYLPAITRLELVKR